MPTKRRTNRPKQVFKPQTQNSRLVTAAARQSRPSSSHTKCHHRVLPRSFTPCDGASPLKRPSPLHIRLRSSLLPKSQVTGHFPHKNLLSGGVAWCRQHGTRGRRGRDAEGENEGGESLPLQPLTAKVTFTPTHVAKKTKKKSVNTVGGKTTTGQEEVSSSISCVRCHRCAAPMPPSSPTPFPPPRRCLTFIFTLQMAGKQQRHCGTARRFGWNNPPCLIIKRNELLTTVCAEDFRQLLKIALEFEDSQQAGDASAGGKSIGSPRDEIVFYPTSLFLLSFSDGKLQKQDTQGVFYRRYGRSASFQ